MALTSRIPEIVAELNAAVEAAAKAGAEQVAEAARQRVPVDTGKLRDAIHTQTDADGSWVIAGNKKAFYGHIVEHGSVHTPPHPFLVPAFEETRGAIEAEIGEAIRKVV